MSRYIDADALKKRINVSDKEITETVQETVINPLKWAEAVKTIRMARDAFLLDVDDEPTVELKPVIHAHWIHIKPLLGKENYRCSHCNNFGGPYAGALGYCGPCGAKMDEKV